MKDFVRVLTEKEGIELVLVFFNLFPIFFLLVFSLNFCSLGSQYGILENFVLFHVIIHDSRNYKATQIDKTLDFVGFHEIGFGILKIQNQWTDYFDML